MILHSRVNLDPFTDYAGFTPKGLNGDRYHTNGSELGSPLSRLGGNRLGDAS
jgi:hypothetical protein